MYIFSGVICNGEYNHCFYIVFASLVLTRGLDMYIVHLYMCTFDWILFLLLPLTRLDHLYILYYQNSTIGIKYLVVVESSKWSKLSWVTLYHCLLLCFVMLLILPCITLKAASMAGSNRSWPSFNSSPSSKGGNTNDGKSYKIIANSVMFNWLGDLSQYSACLIKYLATSIWC